MEFTKNLEAEDKAVFEAIALEKSRQQNQVELIASENIVSPAVLEAQGSIMTNKYAEGYPHRRYYGGCEFVDMVEDLAIERAKKLFNAAFANVQPHSGSQANTAVYVALLQPNDLIMGMSLDAGGHLTHGSRVSISGKWLKSIQYGVVKETGLIDYEQAERLALENKPKLIIAGGSAYPRQVDFARFREIADKVGAYLMVDMAHFAGLVAGGVHPNPLEYADVVTTTTHKTLRGPRGGMILTNNGEIAKKINSAIFPGTQGGPLEHVIAAKAVCFQEALQPEYKEYQKQIVKNAQALCKGLMDRGIKIVSGGTDNHLVLVDLTPADITGKDAEKLLESVGLTVNKNTIPNEQRSPFVASGIRVGSAAATTRGFTKDDFYEVGLCIAGTVFNADDDAKLADIKKKVDAMLEAHPLYPGLEY